MYVDKLNELPVEIKKEGNNSNEQF